MEWSICLLGPCELGKLGQHSWGKFLSKRIKGKQGPGVVCVSLIVTGAGVTWDVMFPLFPLIKCGT